MNRAERRTAAAGERHAPAAKPLVCIAMPCNRGVEPQTVNTLFQITERLAREGINSTIYFGLGGTIETARSELAAKFYQSAATHLLFVDSDVAFAPDLVLRMLACKRPMVACVYPKRSFSGGRTEHFRADAGTFTQEIAPDGTIAIAGCGLGCALITREAIGQMRDAYPDLAQAEGVVRLFDLSRFDGLTWGEDYSFFQRWRDIGGDVRILVDAPMEHCLTVHGFTHRWAGNFRDTWAAERAKLLAA